MNRKELTRIVQELAVEHDYNFFIAKKESCFNAISQYPAALMLYPEFREIEGRERGKIRYRITLYLLRAEPKISPEEREDLLDAMESDMLEIFSELSERALVTAVSSLKMSPSVGAITNHGEVALVAEAEVLTKFSKRI